MDNINDAMAGLLNQLIEKEARKISEETAGMEEITPEVKKRIRDKIGERIEQMERERNGSNLKYSKARRAFCKTDDLIDLRIIDQADTLTQAKSALELIIQTAEERYRRKFGELEGRDCTD